MLGTMQPGHIFTIEPMINEGTHQNKVSIAVCVSAAVYCLCPSMSVSVSISVSMATTGYVSVSLAF